MTDVEVEIKRVLRIYRNAMVAHIRLRLHAKFGNGSEAAVSALFGKVDPQTQKTQWETMKSNATLARSQPGISTTVSDCFELLGVSDFVNVFTKFPNELIDSRPSMDATAHSSLKNGLLRYMQQVKAFRDPNAHEVTEESDFDSLVLCAANARAICKALGLDAASQEMAKILDAALLANSTRAAVFVHISQNRALASDAMKHLNTLGIISDVGTARIDADRPQIEAKFDAPLNVVIPVASAGTALDSAELAALELVLIACKTAQVIPICLIDRALDARTVSTMLSPDLRTLFDASEPILFVPEYAAEASAKVIKRLRPSVTKRTASLKPPPQIVVASAVHDNHLAPKLFAQLRLPDLQEVRIVSPFMTDMRHTGFSGSTIATALISARERGCDVRIITRPPLETDADYKEKQLLLTRLGSEKIEIFVNKRLHSKVYLFRREVQRLFWAVGSHNLTTHAHNSSLETSLIGFRSQEYQQAATAYDRVRKMPETVSFEVWQTRKMKADTFKSNRSEGETYD